MGLYHPRPSCNSSHAPPAAADAPVDVSIRVGLLRVSWSGIEPGPCRRSRPPLCLFARSSYGRAPELAVVTASSLGIHLRQWEDPRGVGPPPVAVALTGIVRVEHSEAVARVHHVLLGPAHLRATVEVNLGPDEAWTTGSGRWPALGPAWLAAAASAASASHRHAAASGSWHRDSLGGGGGLSLGGMICPSLPPRLASADAAPPSPGVRAAVAIDGAIAVTLSESALHHLGLLVDEAKAAAVAPWRDREAGLPPGNGERGAGLLIVNLCPIRVIVCQDGPADAEVRRAPAWASAVIIS